ncbi:hypothetical protein ACJIZ3_003492 [Penstemon smallii]|uniref:SS18 N-terminal domain-containing protein n=1 Tax=Penstemon smallii TaxID=265156 RepID=A0ABD3U9D7_9LAMI
MQKQVPQTMNSAPSTPLNLISTEQIQKYLDENRNLIMAILENQNLGKMAECAQYQAILQKNLMYLAAIADAQPPGSTTPSQPPAGSVTPQGNPHMLQNMAPTMQQQQQPPVSKLPFQLNATRPQEQQNQLLQFQQQQQLQAQFNLGGGANNAFHLLMQPGLGNSGGSMDMRGSHPGGLKASSNNGKGNSGSGPVEGRE